MLVLKGCVDLPGIFFGTLFCKGLNIDTPACRIIEYIDPEFNDMILNLERATLTNTNTYHKITYDIKERPFLLIYEYVPNLILYDFGISRADMIFKEQNFKSREIFMSIGKILAVDVLFNNYDRLPWLWDNPGNPNNLLFRVNMDLLPPNSDFKDHKFLDIFIENAVAIDTKPICLDPIDKVQLKKLGEYLNTLAENLKEFFYEMKNLMIFGKRIDSFDFKCFNKLSEFFNNSCGRLLTSLNSFHMSLGFIITLSDIIKINFEDLQILITYVQKSAINKDWADVYKNNAKLLNMDYFKYIINFFKQLKEENEEIFNWVEDITQGYYSTNFKLNLTNLLAVQDILKYKKPMPTDKVKVDKPEKPEENKDKIEIDFDDFNMNKNDKKKFKNDVHNGIYDIYNIDDSMILEIKKREYLLPNSDKKEVEITELKPRPEPKIEVKPPEEEFDPHKKYTRDEFRDKVKKDELKNTLFMKKKLNPEEARFLEEKIKDADESFLQEANEEERERLKTEERDRSKEKKNNNNSNDTGKTFANREPTKTRDKK
jgi:hypothetical protein